MPVVRGRTSLPWEVGPEFYEILSILLWIFIYFYYVLINLFHMCLCGALHMTHCACGSQDSFWELVLFLRGYRVGTQVSGFTCPMRHLTCHPRSFLMTIIALVKIDGKFYF